MRSADLFSLSEKSLVFLVHSILLFQGFFQTFFQCCEVVIAGDHGLFDFFNIAAFFIGIFLAIFGLLLPDERYRLLLLDLACDTLAVFDDKSNFLSGTGFFDLCLGNIAGCRCLHIGLFIQKFLIFLGLLF